MMNHTLLLKLLLIFGFIVSCQSKSTDDQKNTDSLQEVEEGETYRYLADDQEHYYSVIFLKNDTSQHLVLLDETNGQQYELQSAQAASGSKYQNQEGYFFWIKGEEFMWGKDDSISQKGHLIVDEKRSTNEASLFDLSLQGNYVDDSYAKREEGFDWVAISIGKINAHTMRVSIRSRADKKKPTCTLDVNATVISENQLKAFEDDKAILFNFENNQLTIKTENEADDGILYFFCSGGASIGGTYSKIEGELDHKQIDPTQYAKTLYMGDQIFFLSVKENQLTIESPTLEIDKGPYKQALKGEVINAELGDLDIDNQAEIFIYTKDDKGFGHLVGYSVNTGKSLSMINMPDIQTNPEASDSYEGQDEFAVVESTLVRRYPIAGTDQMRQIQYKLKDGEAAKQLIIDKIIEY
ncbi:MliC family protein [Echinicola sp. CAU 1574]|uniref:MliC family protein n=1 Tax=Echinicola arenosa TaxID=2774144 RepID=A0ABR9AIP9_9BACT|nr:MliC family protein [Echinicola arenosa]MBD8488714.1 MliC family protein [Echinicola arenosa]